MCSNSNYNLAALLMSIFVVGINHKTAPITVREKVYFALESLSLYLQDLLNRGCVHEAVLLSTCNRSELICEANDIEHVRAWFSAQTSLPYQELEPALYVYRDGDAVSHIMSVACGLDSMVLGEPQILGQIKQAYSESCSAGAVGPLFHRLFQSVFSVAKEIRTTTAIGACPVSVASAAAHFAKQELADFAHAKVVLIGAGETTELMLRYLRAHLAQPMIVVNRSLDKAQALAEQYGAQAYSLDELSAVLRQADLVFSATGSAVPLVTEAMLASVMPMRALRPLMLIDIAVPRDIEPEAANVAGVRLYCIDDLKNIIERNRQGREHAADKARDLIHTRSAEFVNEWKSFDKVAHTIRAYRGQIEEICHEELMKAKLQLQQGVEPGRVLDAFARAYTNKLLHAPSVQLRQAGAEGRFEILRLAKQLFALPDPEIELI